MKQENGQMMMGRQWCELDQMQIICTLLWTDNHASISSVNFYRLYALSDVIPTELVK